MTSRSVDTKVAEQKKPADYTVVFVGITGSGKSTAGNFFLDKKDFNCEDGLMPVTGDSLAGTATICGKKVKIIDTPGFSNGFKSIDQCFKELSSTLTLAKDGIHAVVFVMSYTRYTTACEDAVKQLLLFGGLQPYVFVMITHAKGNGMTTVKTNEYIQQCLSSPCCADGLKELMKLAGNRVIMVECVDFIAENYHEQKREEFIAMVENMFKSNNNKIYTNGMLQAAAFAYEKAKQQQEKEIKVVKERLESIELEIDQLTEQASGTTGKKEIEDKITALKNEKETLKTRFEKISVEQYVIELTDKIVQEQIKKLNLKNKIFSVFVKGCVFGIGPVVGGGIGAAMGSPGAGASTGALIGGAIATAAAGSYMSDDCKQQ